MESANCTQSQKIIGIHFGNGLEGIISDMAIMKIGSVNATAIQNLLRSFLYVFSSSEISGSTRTKSIPQMGQDPGSSETTSGCIGQVYWVAVGRTEASLTRSIPQTGQSPGLS